MTFVGMVSFWYNKLSGAVSTQTGIFRDIVGPLVPTTRNCNVPARACQEPSRLEPSFQPVLIRPGKRINRTPQNEFVTVKKNVGNDTLTVNGSRKGLDPEKGLGCFRQECQYTSNDKVRRTDQSDRSSTRQHDECYQGDLTTGAQ
jgi:hypothetical protein